MEAPVPSDTPVPPELDAAVAAIVASRAAVTAAMRALRGTIVDDDAPCWLDSADRQDQQRAAYNGVLDALNQHGAAASRFCAVLDDLRRQAQEDGSRGRRDVALQLHDSPYTRN